MKVRTVKQIALVETKDLEFSEFINKWIAEDGLVNQSTMIESLGEALYHSPSIPKRIVDETVKLEQLLVQNRCEYGQIIQI